VRPTVERRVCEVSPFEETRAMRKSNSSRGDPTAAGCGRPGCHDAASARVVEQRGFEAVQVTCAEIRRAVEEFDTPLSVNLTDSVSGVKTEVLKD